MGLFTHRRHVLIGLSGLTAMIGSAMFVAFAQSAVPTHSLISLSAATTQVAASGKAQIKTLARGHNAFLGQLTMAPGAAVPEHRDPTEEYIFVLSGSGTIVIDGHTSNVSAGDTIYMPANATVSFENGDEEMVALQVFAGPQSADKYARWAEATPITPPPTNEGD